MSDLYEDSAGKVRGVYSGFPVFDGIVVCPDWFLDAHIYRSCPECGGSRVLATGPPLNIGEPCSACADAPTAIVEAALREKARDILVRAIADYCVPPINILAIDEEDVAAATDAILSTVLGCPVRYAEEIGRLEILPTESEDILVLMPLKRVSGGGTAPILCEGDTIAILEEAGKEE